MSKARFHYAWASRPCDFPDPSHISSHNKMASGIRIVDGQVVRGGATPQRAAPGPTPLPSTGLGNHLAALVDYVDEKCGTKGKVFHTPHLPSVALFGVHIHGWSSVPIPHVALVFALLTWLLLLCILPLPRATVMLLLGCGLGVHLLDAAKLSSEKGEALSQACAQAAR